MREAPRLWLLIAWLGSGSLLEAQVNNPADKAKSGAQSRPQAPVEQEPRLLSFERPAILVEGRQASELREEDRVGPYGQPRWTTKRRFGETRTYVIPEGQAEFEYWLIPEFQKHGDPTETKTQYELEFGLPARFQLDFYVVSHQEGNEGPMEFDEQ